MKECRWISCTKVTLSRRAERRRREARRKKLTPRFWNFFWSPEIPICQLLDSECIYIGQAIFQISAKSVGGNRVFCIFCVFSPIFTQPCQIWLFSRVFGPFLPSEMIINIIGDGYGSILFCIFLFFCTFCRFWLFFCIFGVSVAVGVFWECYWVRR